MTNRRTKQILERIEKISDSEMYDPLPSEEKNRAKRMLQNVEDAIKKNDASAAALYMLEWAECFYSESIRAGKIARKEKKLSAEQKLDWLLRAQSLRVRTPKMSTLKIAQTIAPDHVRIARRFLSECEKEKKLKKKLARASGQ